MAIKVVVEFQAKPGSRAELASVLKHISSTLGRSLPGFLGGVLYEGLDSPDALVEIADWTRRTRRRPRSSTR